MTASTPDELIAGFPQSSLMKVTGEPTFEDLKVIWWLLNTNAMSVASYEGGGRHRHLGIIMTNKEYFTVAVDVFPVPNNPGTSAAVVAGMTTAVIAKTTRLHKEETQVNHTYHNVNQAIKKLIIEAFDDAYLNALSDEILVNANCTSLQLLTHLLTYYAMIAPTELTYNYERLNAPYDPNQPIETLFQQIQDARAFVEGGGQPYGAAMIVNVAYTLLFNTGFFPDACRAWQSRAIAGKTWAQFKLDFATAHRELRITNQTAHQSGFHSTSMTIEQGRDETMQDTVDTISQLATATASDRGTVATLTTTNAKLAKQLEAAQAQIAQLKDDITALNNKIKPAWQGQRPIKTTNNDRYYWYHGYKVAKSHTSATCNMKKSGHKDAANKNNPMGRVQWGKELCGRADKVIDDKLNHFTLSLDCTPSFTEVITNDTAILDSRCTSNFFQQLHRAATHKRRTFRSVLTCLMVLRFSRHIHVTYY
jgi:hypothetical protein